jgi:signal peptidase II
MLYFPIIRTTWPKWIPVMGGDSFEFFSPVFNIADSSISIGLIIILLFQNRFFPKAKEESHSGDVTSEQQVASE